MEYNDDNYDENSRHDKNDSNNENSKKNDKDSKNNSSNDIIYNGNRIKKSRYDDNENSMLRHRSKSFQKWSWKEKSNEGEKGEEE